MAPMGFSARHKIIPLYGVHYEAFPSANYICSVATFRKICNRTLLFTVRSICKALRESSPFRLLPAKGLSICPPRNSERSRSQEAASSCEHLELLEKGQKEGGRLSSRAPYPSKVQGYKPPICGSLVCRTKLSKSSSRLLIFPKHECTLTLKSISYQRRIFHPNSNYWTMQ